MALSAEDISKNYQKHLKIIDTYIGDRKDKVLDMLKHLEDTYVCLLYTSPSPRDATLSRMPSSA